MTEPTDAEIDALWRFEASKNWDSTLAMRTNFTRAALARWGAQPVPAGYALVPVEVRNLYDFMCTAFVPMTGQHDQIAISLDLAKAAMLSAAPQPVDREPVARLEIGKTKGGVSLTHIAEPAAFQLPEGMYALYTADQVLPMRRVPLTRQQLREAYYSETACTLGGDVDFAEKVCRVVEKAHGIKGGQHGTE